MDPNQDNMEETERKVCAWKYEIKSEIIYRSHSYALKNLLESIHILLELITMFRKATLTPVINAKIEKEKCQVQTHSLCQQKTKKQNTERYLFLFLPFSSQTNPGQAIDGCRAKQNSFLLGVGEGPVWSLGTREVRGDIHTWEHNRGSGPSPGASELKQGEQGIPG